MIRVSAGDHLGPPKSLFSLDSSGVRDVGVAGSNPVTPTREIKHLADRCSLARCQVLLQRSTAPQRSSEKSVSYVGTDRYVGAQLTSKRKPLKLRFSVTISRSLVRPVARKDALSPDLEASQPRRQRLRVSLSNVAEVTHDQCDNPTQ